MWGDNKYGQITSESNKILALPGTRNRHHNMPRLGNISEKISKPHEIQLFDSTGKRRDIKYISVGRLFSMALTGDGEINIWGTYYY
jgi:alpha-tubulin suppressor-like RCC1 family protein